LPVDWRRALSSLHAATVELQGQLLAREREVDSHEGAIITWEEGLVAVARTWGGARGT
jgi:hypothetical protein